MTIYLQKTFYAPNASQVLLAAHRAAHNFAPENSLLAVKKCTKVGIDIIEIDIKTSKDGIPMIMHDGTIDRITNGSGPLENHTFEELRMLRLKNADGLSKQSSNSNFRGDFSTCQGQNFNRFGLEINEH
jgi:glycerophosphoryl diester phosphodiesterase